MRRACLGLLLAVSFATVAAAASEDEVFDPFEAAWAATEIVVARPLSRTPGRYEVLERLAGELSVGAHVDVAALGSLWAPRLAAVARVHGQCDTCERLVDRVLQRPFRFVCREHARTLGSLHTQFSRAREDDADDFDESRVVLFLARDANGSFAPALAARESIAWLGFEDAFACRSSSHPSECLLDLVGPREWFLSVVRTVNAASAAQARLEAVANVTDKARGLAALVRAEREPDFVTRALGALAACEDAAVPHLEELLDDPALAELDCDVYAALARTGAPRARHVLARALVAEHARCVAAAATRASASVYERWWRLEMLLAMAGDGAIDAPRELLDDIASAWPVLADAARLEPGLRSMVELALRSALARR